MSDTGETENVWMGPRQVPVWPKNLKLFEFDKDVFFTINSDLADLQQPLIDAILEAEFKKLDPDDRQSPGQGGNKVRDLDSLGVPFFDLLNERARRLFMHVTGKKTAVVDDCWEMCIAMDFARCRTVTNVPSHRSSSPWITATKMTRKSMFSTAC